MCSHTLLKRGKKWSALEPVKETLGHPVKEEKLKDIKLLLSKLGITQHHHAMPFWQKVFSNPDAVNDSSDDDSEIL
ncbi:hypothetical protein L9F63_027510 [Diploptera punctata]|uniref:Uncharacterized protein n=1 Tax=Diploptera punctata TaxID=6984 RepID=A0AAD8EKT8_DIPPU|nr:hypothetical protein L9F63_027510 [Diploptera punctata]